MRATLLPIAGLDRYQRALKHYRDVFGPPWLEGLRSVATVIGLAGQRGAPQAQKSKQPPGKQLHARIKGAAVKQITARGMGWVAVRVSARTAKPSGRTWKAVRATSTASRATQRLSGKGGYPYGLLLEYSPRHGHRYWLHNAMDKASGSVQPIFDGVGRKITALWEGYAHK